MEDKYWEKKNSDIAILGINQDFESQRLQLQQADQWADEAQRDKNELVWRIGNEEQTLPKNLAKDCQEIEELRRICCEETDRARQARTDELSMHLERNPSTVSPLLTQIHDLFLVRSDRIL